jgi:hypothetical protein
MFLRDLIRGLRWPTVEAPAVSPPSRTPGTWPKNHAIAEWGPGELVTVEDCCCGIQVFGATGSGKTSGSLALLAKSMMRDGWGMLVLTTKPAEADQWVKWAKDCGRDRDVVRVQPNGEHHFNLLDYLSRHPAPGASLPTNISDLLMELASHAKPKKQGSDTSEFFLESANKLVLHAIKLLQAAKETLSLRNIGQVIASAPTHELDLKDAESLKERYVSKLLLRARETLSAAEAKDLRDYWLHEYTISNERTRGDVIATLSSVIFRFTEPPVRDLVASDQENTYIPEMVDVGRILILDCPVLLYHQAGRLYQIVMKLLVQKAVLRRAAADTTRPVVIFADEAQNFATHADYNYLATCRDFRGATVYATQTIDNYKEAVGSEDAVEALLASLVTKVFHANAGRTNEWAEKLIASDWRSIASESLNQRGQQHEPSFGRSQSEQVHPQVLASRFTRLRTGGARNNGIVEGVVFQAGRLFQRSGTPILEAAFRQGA